MATISERLHRNLVGAVMQIPRYAIGGFFCGYVYSRLADLPADQAAKYWMINIVAHSFITRVAVSFTENVKVNAFVTAIHTGVSAAFFIHQMRKF